jgi:hypothetical protein
MNILIIGQSLAAAIDSAALSSRFAARTGIAPNIVNAAIGGVGLLPQSSPQYWTDFSAAGPAQQAVNAMAGNVPDIIVCDVGQQDAFGPGCTVRQFSNGYFDLYEFLSKKFGKLAGDISFGVIPLGNPVATRAPNARQVLAAEYSIMRWPGMLVGPETWDLPTQADGVHLTPDGYTTYGTRVGDFCADVLKVQQPPSPPPTPATGTSWSVANATTVPGKQSFYTVSADGLTATSTVAASGAISFANPLPAQKCAWALQMSGGQNAALGIVLSGDALGWVGTTPHGYGISGWNGGIWNNAVQGSAYGAIAVGTLVRFAYDPAGSLWIGVGASGWLGGGNPEIGTAPTIMFTPGTYYAAGGDADAGSAQSLIIVPGIAPPAGFVAL